MSLDPTIKQQITQEIFHTMGVSLSRAQLAAKASDQYGTDRELYKTLGWKETLSLKDFQGRYERQDIAKTIINAYPEATWRGIPQIVDDSTIEDPSDFMEEWRELSLRLKVWNVFKRIDILAGLGEYSALYIGTNQSNPERPFNKRRKNVLYLSPYAQCNAQVDVFTDDPRNPHFGLPELYQIDATRGNSRIGGTGQVEPDADNSISFEAHWTRVVHVAEGLLENDVFGTPRLEAPFNRLSDLEKISGGSAEMYWRGAFPGLAFIANEDAELDDDDADDFDDEIKKYVHDLSRYMRLQGVDVQQLESQGIEPGDFITAQLQLISSVTRIPLRILIGSERGELASTQDDVAWRDRVAERRIDFAEPVVLRPFIDRLIEFNMLPEPKGEEYRIIWPDLTSMDALTQSEIAENLSKAMANYVESGAMLIMPRETFLIEIMKFDKNIVASLKETLDAELDAEILLNPTTTEIEFDDNENTV